MSSLTHIRREQDQHAHMLIQPSLEVGKEIIRMMPGIRASTPQAPGAARIAFMMETGCSAAMACRR